VTSLPHPLGLATSLLFGVAFGGVMAASAAGQDSPPPWRFTGPSFVAVSVSDLEASVAWYGRVLGLAVVRSLDLPDASVRVRLLRGGDVIVELMAHDDPIGVDPDLADEPPFRFLGLLKSGLFVDDIEAFHAWLASEEVDADETIGRDEALGHATFIFRDPDGNILQAFAPVSPNHSGPGIV
jgi:catechol 2,3-dioxygenase-like lactoylglutathione lyase family enzyme